MHKAYFNFRKATILPSTPLTTQMEILSSCRDGFVDTEGCSSAIMYEMEALEMARVTENEEGVASMLNM